MEYMYYGRHDGKKPKTEVGLTMIDEHIRAILERQENTFRKEAQAMLLSLRKEHVSDIGAMKKQIATLQFEIKKLTQKERDEMNEMKEKHAKEKLEKKLKKESEKEDV